MKQRLKQELTNSTASLHAQLADLEKKSDALDKKKRLEEEAEAAAALLKSGHERLLSKNVELQLLQQQQSQKLKLQERAAFVKKRFDNFVICLCHGSPVMFI